MASHPPVPAVIVPVPKRAVWVAAAAVVFSIVVALVSLGSLVVVLTRLSDAQTRAARTVCIAEMQGNVFAALGASLDAPPSPSPQRAASVVAIAERASRFKDIPKYCPAGHEHPVVPKG